MASTTPATPPGKEPLQIKVHHIATAFLHWRERDARHRAPVGPAESRSRPQDVLMAAHFFVSALKQERTTIPIVMLGSLPAPPARRAACKRHTRWRRR
jgi:hypothetical protein